jgi:hypothetical protein
LDITKILPALSLALRDSFLLKGKSETQKKIFLKSPHFHGIFSWLGSGAMPLLEAAWVFPLAKELCLFCGRFYRAGNLPNYRFVSFFSH